MANPDKRAEIFGTILGAVGADGVMTDETRAALRRQFVMLLADRDDMDEAEKAKAMDKFENDILRHTNAYAVSAKTVYDTICRVGAVLDDAHKGILAIAMYLSHEGAHGAAHAFGLGEAYNSLRLADACLGKAAQKMQQTLMCCFPGTLDAEDEAVDDPPSKTPMPPAPSGNGVN